MDSRGVTKRHVDIHQSPHIGSQTPSDLLVEVPMTVQSAPVVNADVGVEPMSHQTHTEYGDGNGGEGRDE